MSSVSGSSHMDVYVQKGARQEITEALKRSLKMIGMQAESYAKMLCPVKTGLLRNSIAYACGGEPASISSYSAESGGGTGSYTGTAPADADGTLTLYLGSNVEYAPYVELGHAQEVGRYVPAIGKRLVNSFAPAYPFLRPAIENHKDEYHHIIIEELNKIPK